MPENREYMVEGVQVNEALDANEFFVEGVQLNETVEAVGGASKLPIIMQLMAS